MTSSLVGSEMCIRDRSIRLWIHHQLQGVGVDLNLDKTEVWKASDASVPVSYTHLTLPTICSV
eukprot:2648277-Prorocentrum_lima.AAC.1